MAEETFDKIHAVTEEESKQKAVSRAKGYILENWSGIMLSMTGKDGKVGCSAEGHVSHIYSDRMSSRPLGWCHVGADKMARLRIYRHFYGDRYHITHDYSSFSYNGLVEQLEYEGFTSSQAEYGANKVYR